MFRKINLDLDNIFDKLINSVNFEHIIRGRKGANIISSSNDIIPLVRTTTKYNKPLQYFSQIHHDIVSEIKKVSNIDNLQFNNALIELYDDSYRNMKYHTDQSLDLADNSYICLFSCYDSDQCIRQLNIKNKVTGICSEIVLTNNSAVLFSTETNKQFLHKIVLPKKSNNNWLGIIFRLSKTFIRFINNKSYLLPYDIELKLATTEQEKEFMRQKGVENSELNYNYPFIDYTLSFGDLLPIN